MVETKFEDNSKEILRALKKARQNALTAVGITAEGYAKKNETAVDTGRLRNSITYATKKRQNVGYNYRDNNGKGYSDKIGSGAEENAVYIGTNVEYAPYIEDGSRGRKALHFLQRACTEHDEEYKQLTKQALEAVDK